MSERLHLAASPSLLIIAAVVAVVSLAGEEKGFSSKQVRCKGGIVLIQASLQTTKTILPTDLVFSKDAGDTSPEVPSSQRTSSQVAKHDLKTLDIGWDQAVNHGRVLFQKAVKITQSAETVAVSLVALGTARNSSSMVWPLLLGVSLFCFVSLLACSRWGSSVAARDLSGLTPPGWQPTSIGKDSEQSLRLPAHAFSKQTLVGAPDSFIQPRSKATSPAATPLAHRRLSAKEEVFDKFATAGPGAATSPQTSVGYEFCPDLVVPKGCECVLLVPIAPLFRERFSIYDPNGNVVLHVLPESVGRQSTPSTGAPGLKSILRSRGGQSRHASVGSKTTGASWYLELTTAAGDVLAQSSCQCSTPRDSPEWSSQPSFQIMTADGDCYATLRRKVEDGYELSTPAQTIHFWGSFNHHAVNITDAAGKLLATTELVAAEFDPAGEYYQLQVAPLVDVGLLLCSLICIGKVESLVRRT